MSLSRAGRRKVSQAAIVEGGFLEERVPFQAFATLTFTRTVSLITIEGALQRWIAEVIERAELVFRCALIPRENQWEFKSSK